MYVEEVNNREGEKAFLQVPLKIYRDYPKWIQPLEKDIRFVFDKRQNPHFKDGLCQRWLLKNDHHEVVGRIAAFIDFKTASKNDQPTGGVGFFECINNQEGATLLFDTCREWLATKGLEAMDGPINFGERDKWWGLLVDGHNLEPNYCMNYNPPYYQSLFDAYGFRDYFKQYTYYRKVAGGIDEGIKKRADRLNQSGQFRFMNIQGMTTSKVVADFQEVYNKAWSSYPEAVPMTNEQVRALFKQIKPIMDPQLIWFGYYGDHPIAFAVMLPEVNQVFRKFNGKLGLLQKIKFIWLLRRKICTKMLGVAFGIVPRFQRKGVESAMIEAISRMTYDERNTFNYEEVEHNWVGDFNPQMMHVHELMGGSIRKTHVTYRYLFDRTKTFTRHPLVNMAQPH